MNLELEKCVCVCACVGEACSVCHCECVYVCGNSKYSLAWPHHRNTHTADPRAVQRKVMHTDVLCLFWVFS